MTTPPAPTSTTALAAACERETSVVTTVHDDPCVEVLVDDVAQVEAEDLVGAEDEDDVGAEVPDRVEVAVEVVAVALAETGLGRRPAALLGREPLQPTPGAVEVPRPAGRDVLVQARGEVLHGQPHVGDPAVRERRQGEVDELVLAGIRKGGLGPLAGEDVHPRALAAGLDDGQHLGSPRHGTHSAPRWRRARPRGPSPRFGR